MIVIRTMQDLRKIWKIEVFLCREASTESQWIGKQLRSNEKGSFGERWTAWNKRTDRQSTGGPKQTTEGLKNTCQDIGRRLRRRT